MKDSSSRSLRLMLGVLAGGALLAVLMLAGRFAATQRLHYLFLVWNLFLAWLPLLFALLLWQRRSRAPHSLGGAALMACWLLFFPNAPYLVTDIMHIRQTALAPWFDALMLFTFAWNGVLAGLLSLWLVHRVARQHYGRAAGWAVALLCMFLSAYGIYLGRFLRFNSWDLLAHPGRLLHAVAAHASHPLAHPRALIVTAAFGLALTAFYGSLLASAKLLRQSREQD